MTRYSASMTEVSSQVIHRGVNVATLGFHCEYNNIVNVTADERYVPLQGAVSIYSAYEDVTFHVMMNLFSDKALQNSITTGSASPWCKKQCYDCSSKDMLGNAIKI